MDRYTRFLILRVNNGLVDVRAVHAFAPVPGQQGGVNIDDPVGKSLYQRIRYLP